MKTHSPPIKIGELAKRTHCEVVTIRYYEQEGLLPEPARSEGNFRLYDESHVERLMFIRHCRSLDMSLSDVRTLLELRDDQTQACDEVITLLDARIQDVESRMNTLRDLKQHLVSLRERCGGEQCVESCGILQDLAHATY